MVARVVCLFQGRSYRLDKETGYYLNSTNRKRLHVAVWEHHHGPVPPDHEVHHKDHNRGHNDIENLECLLATEHRQLHWAEDDGTRLAAVRANLVKATEASKLWHSSPAGLEFHRQLGRSVHARYVPVDKHCQFCSVAFKDRKIGGQSKFCSNACKSAARRASGVDQEDRCCPECGAVFSASRYSGKVNCSRSCAMRARHRANGPRGV